MHKGCALAERIALGSHNNRKHFACILLNFALVVEAACFAYAPKSFLRR